MKSFINCELWRRQTHKACCTAADVCQNKKENMSRPSSSSPQYQNNIIFMFARLYKTANVLRVSPFLRRRLLFYYLLRCDAAMQRDLNLCDLYRVCFGNDCAHFVWFRYSFQPAKHKEQSGQKNQTNVFISNFPAATVLCPRCILCTLSVSFSIKSLHCSPQSKILRCTVFGDACKVLLPGQTY